MRVAAGCPNEEELVAYAEGALAPAAHARLAEHLAGCDDCLRVLRGLAEASAVRGLTAAPAADPGPDQLLRQLIARDAPARERLICTVYATLLTLILVITSVVAPPYGVRIWYAPWLLGFYVAWEWAWVWLLGRGVFHRLLPPLNAFLEVTSCAVFTAAIAHVLGAEKAISAPLQLLWCTVVMFSAARMVPALTVAAGVIAALELLLVAWLFGGVSKDTGLALRMLFLFGAGTAGAFTARLLERWAFAALHAVRELDLMGRYVLHERVGQGGMAEVFRATYCPEGGFRKQVAVKRVLPRYSEDPKFVAALREEARLGAMLQHPNVVQVLDCGTFRGRFLITLEWVDGVSLQALLARGPLPVAAAVYVASELCAALQYIHHREDEHGRSLRLVHRDLNPPNVLVSRHGEVKLADFGVAHATTRTAVGEAGFFGKEAFAAPEQRRGEPVDGRADLYALGATLAAMAGDQAPEGLRGLIDRLRAENPADRPQTAEEVRRELALLGGSKEALLGRLGAR